MIHLIFLIVLRYLAKPILFFGYNSENFCVHNIYQLTCIEYFSIYRIAFAGFIGNLFLAGLSIIRDEVSGFFIGNILANLIISDHLWSIKVILYFLLIFLMLYIHERHFVRIAFLSSYILPLFLVAIYLIIFNSVYIVFDPNMKNVLSSSKKSKSVTLILPRTKLKIIKIACFLIALGIILTNRNFHIQHILLLFYLHNIFGHQYHIHHSLLYLYSGPFFLFFPE